MENTFYSDEERKTILESFTRELYYRDKDAIMNNKDNIFTIREIWEKVLYSYDYSHVERLIKEINKEEKQQSDIEFIGKIEEGRIRLTDHGRNKFVGL
ncbi:MAG TPA: hypothetical protein VFK40_01025 [Nitrososphaeraceae archaeon]|nr:hypothetical protein [Nitrososphaeraceae archaeon]